MKYKFKKRNNFSITSLYSNENTKLSWAEELRNTKMEKRSDWFLVGEKSFKTLYTRWPRVRWRKKTQIRFLKRTQSRYTYWEGVQSTPASYFLCFLNTLSTAYTYTSKCYQVFKIYTHEYYVLRNLKSYWWLMIVHEYWNVYTFWNKLLNI